MPGLIAILRRERARDRGRQRVAMPAMLGVVLAIGTIPSITVLQTALAQRAEKRQWDIRGPSCPVVAAPSPLATSRRRPPRSFEYGDARFTRAFGAVSCAGFRGARPYRVCQFNNPGAVTVETAAAKVTFEARSGQRITVRVEDGRATCVVGGWFNL